MTSPDSIAYPQDGYGILGGAASGFTPNGGLAVNPTEAIPKLFGDFAGAQLKPTGGTVVRGLADKLGDVLNVRDFGAVGDASTDDSAAFQAALTAAAALPYGGTVRVPTGRYRLAAALSASIDNNQGVALQGEGAQFTELVWSADVDGITVSIGVGNTTPYRSPTSPGAVVRVSGVSLVRGSTASVGRTALSVTSTSAGNAGLLQVQVRDVIARGDATGGGWLKGISYSRVSQTHTEDYSFWPKGGDLTSTALSFTTGSGFSSVDHRILGMRTNGCGTGIYIGPGVIQGFYVANSALVGPSIGIDWDNSTGSAGNADLLTLVNTHIGVASGGVAAVRANFVRNILVAGCYFLGRFISLTNCNRLTCVGNSFGGSGTGNQVAVSINNTAPVDNSSGGLIANNQFFTFTTVPTIQLLGSTSGVLVANNAGAVCDILGSDAGTGNTWTGNTGFTASGGVSGSLVAQGSANALTISGSATNAGTSIAASGSDVNIDINVTAKGGNNINLANTTASAKVTVAPGTSNTPIIRGSSAAASLQIMGNAGVSLLILGSNGASGGAVSLTGAHADNSWVNTAPTSGASVTIPNNCSTYYMTPAGTLAALTVTLPAGPVTDQRVLLGTTAAITALTVSPNAGQTVRNAPTTLAADASVEFHHRAGTWYRVR